MTSSPTMSTSYPDSDAKPDYLSVMEANPSPTTGNDPKNIVINKIEDWRKNKTQDKLVKSGLVWC